MSNSREIYTHTFPIDKKQSIFTCQINNEFKMNKELLKVIRKSGDKQDFKTNVKAYMTDWDMGTEPGFKRLKEIAFETAVLLSKNQYDRNIGKIANGNNFVANIHGIWGMIYKDSNYTIAHDHWPALWSGVYYIQVPETLKGGLLYFPELKQSVIPKEGLLVIFDGYLKHGVKELSGEGERIAVSFNIQ